jgi:hypothetical protein
MPGMYLIAHANVCPTDSADEVPEIWVPPLNSTDPVCPIRVPDLCSNETFIFSPSSLFNPAPSFFPTYEPSSNTERDRWLQLIDSTCPFKCGDLSCNDECLDAFAFCPNALFLGPTRQDWYRGDIPTRSTAPEDRFGVSYGPEVIATTRTGSSLGTCRLTPIKTSSRTTSTMTALGVFRRLESTLVPAANSRRTCNMRGTTPTRRMVPSRCIRAFTRAFSSSPMPSCVRLGFTHPTKPLRSPA